MTVFGAVREALSRSDLRSCWKPFPCQLPVLLPPGLPLSHGMFNTLRPRQNGRHFADDILNCISMNENVWIQNNISLKFVPKGPINNIPALVQVMAWRRPGDKPLSEPMVVRLPTHICVTRPQWVNQSKCCCDDNHHAFLISEYAWVETEISSQ